MLLKLGFDQQVAQLFLSCIFSIRYKISHAGKVFGSIIPRQGLRQGDQHPSYLFIVCTEGLIALLHDFENKSLIKGIKVARSAPPISHMFFAEDSYIFCKASMESAENVLTLLKIFEQASGQKLNVDKSSLFLVIIPLVL